MSTRASGLGPLASGLDGSAVYTTSRRSEPATVSTSPDDDCERPQRLVVVLGRCPGVQLVPDALPERIGGEVGLHEPLGDPFGVGEVGAPRHHATAVMR